MKHIGMLRAMALVSRYRKMPEEARQILQNKRLKELISYAREHSPFYHEMYQALPPNTALADLPSVDKKELMQNFDQWITDPDVHIKDIHTFMENPDNIGRKFLQKYYVFTTSGSTGNPSLVLCDKTANSVMAAVNGLRSIARKDVMQQMIRRGFKTAGVFATGGFYLGNSSVRSRLLQMPWKKRQMMVTSILNPISQTVKELNDFQPAMLGGYPTALELLMDEQKEGRLHIAPALIMAGGEYLSDALRKALYQTFACAVQASYACTEGGTVACECREGHFHVNDDWIILEPVDANNQPVHDGTLSDKILLTNLSNFTQPFIRYEVTDRIRLFHTPCPCGNPSPWLQIEGRTDEILTFQGEKGPVRIAPLALYALLKEVHEIRRFQLVGHEENHLELRLICEKGWDKQAVYEEAKSRLTAFLHKNGIPAVSVALSSEEPQVHPGSGKFQHVFNAKKQAEEVIKPRYK